MRTQREIAVGADGRARHAAGAGRAAGVGRWRPGPSPGCTGTSSARRRSLLEQTRVRLDSDLQHDIAPVGAAPLRHWPQPSTSCCASVPTLQRADGAEGGRGQPPASTKNARRLGRADVRADAKRGGVQPATGASCCTTSARGCSSARCRQRAVAGRRRRADRAGPLDLQRVRAQAGAPMRWRTSSSGCSAAPRSRRRSSSPPRLPGSCCAR